MQSGSYGGDGGALSDCGCDCGGVCCLVCGPASGIDPGFRGARPDRDGSDAAHEHRADVGQLWRIDGVICAAGPETSEQRALEV